MARPSVVVIGGGISALAAAWELTGGREGPTSDTPRVEIFESQSRVGGALAVAEFAGRTIDLGADGFLARRPEVTTLIDEMGWSAQLEPIAASGAWLFLSDQLNPLPEHMVLGVPTSARSLDALPGLSRRARWNAWRDEHLPRRLRVGDDATIGQITRTKLGDELTERVIEPMIGGIQAGRVDELSAAAVFPALLDAVRKGGSLMRAIRPDGVVNPGPSAPTSEGPAFATLRGGVGSLPRELARQLEARGVFISRSTPVIALRRSSHSYYGWEVDTATTTTPANVVIVATGPHGAAELLGDYDEALGALARIDSAGAAMVTFSLERDSVSLPPTGTGVLVPLGTPWRDGDTMMVTAVTLLDRKWPHLASVDDVLVRVHVGRIDDARALSLNDEELVARVSNEMTTILGSWPTPNSSMVARWPGALPQYRLGHLELIRAAHDAAGRINVALAGNAYEGVGIPASVGSGRRAARSALAALRTN